MYQTPQYSQTWLLSKRSLAFGGSKVMIKLFPGRGDEIFFQARRIGGFRR
jgi:hypothetical protein